MTAHIPASAFALLLLLSNSAPCRAQGAPEGSPMAPSGPIPGGPADMENQTTRTAPEEAPAGPPSIEDVRINFPTIVQAFIDKRSVEGVWPLRDKQTGKLRKLKVVTIKAGQAAPEENGLYSAPVVLADTAANDERLTAIFTVNFSGAEWAVEKMRFIKTKASPKTKRKGAAR